MRIGIDARELCGRPTGVGRYLAGLLREWASDQRARRHEFVLYAPEGGRLAADATSGWKTRTVGGAPGVLWEQVRLPWAARADRLDLFFAPGYTAPLMLGVPAVVAIHDLSFLAHPEWFRTREGLRRRTLTRRAARRARAIVTISEFSRRELIERLDLPASKVHVIPPGLGANRQDVAGGGRPARASQPHDARLLYVGSIFNRRHVPDLIRAFARVAASHPDASLDIVGDNRTFPFEDVGRIIGNESLDGRARWHSYATDTDLARLYEDARAFAFLSEYEGLGLTPLEALAAGVPPVLLDTPVARESCGDAALYVATGDLDATADALERALFDAATRERILAAAPAVIAKYSWTKAARETLALLEASAGRGSA